MSEFFSVEFPDGRLRELVRTGDEKPSSLAHFLSGNGVSLNFRCGCKGKCNGCRVHIDGAEEPVRSCQVDVATIEPGARIQIPQRSLHNRSISGLTEFTILASLEAPHESQRGLGLAIDVGTTTVAATLWCLQTGECIGSMSTANSQMQHGDNVLSRVEYCISNEEGSDALRKAIWQKTLKPLIKKLCKDRDISINDIDKCVLAANTVMLHSISGHDVSGFGTYPFTPVYLESKQLLSLDEELGIADLPIDLLPSMGPFVGADITAGAVAADMPNFEGNCLLIDFGTNGEMLLKANGEYLGTATAAGPAFEGGHLSCGATARNGVVSSLNLKDGSWELDIIGDVAEPAGLSGAAYIDVIAKGTEAGLITEYGRFVSGNPGIVEWKGDDWREHRISLKENLFVSEVDVAEILQAKAAISAGVLTLLDCAGIEIDDLDKIFVAGGFGFHMNHENAIAIGLLPDVDDSKLEILGNASLGGASMVLLDPDQEKVASTLAAKTKIIELNQQECFSDFYTDCLEICKMSELDL